MRAYSVNVFAVFIMLFLCFLTFQPFYYFFFLFYLYYTFLYFPPVYGHLPGLEMSNTHLKITFQLWFQHSWIQRGMCLQPAICKAVLCSWYTFLNIRCLTCSGLYTITQVVPYLNTFLKGIQFTESSGLEVTSGDCLVQPLCQGKATLQGRISF